MDKHICKREAKRLFDSDIEFYISPMKIKSEIKKENVTFLIDKKFKKKNKINDFDELFIWFCRNYCVKRVNGSYPIFYIEKGEN